MTQTTVAKSSPHSRSNANQGSKKYMFSDMRAHEPCNATVNEPCFMLLARLFFLSDYALKYAPAATTDAHFS